ncbi:MAG TPA: sensor histidine kinase [Bacteroidia bacterium]|jgi:two-component sensor histidine kinase|nr:sensor histidine kinase [Bacteroidia bacterium]
MKTKIHIQSEQGRIKAINKFCYTTALMASVYVVILFILGLKLHALVMTGVTSAFLACAFLNKKFHHSLSRTGIIVSTNFAVFYFSVLLGFKAGVHLFLYTSPLIAYLLYDFDQRKKIFIAFGTYLVTFLVIFAIHKFHLIAHIDLTEETLGIFYVLNFSFSLTLCFTLIIYFAFNNSAYTKMLVETNKTLEEKQQQLKEEISNKNKAQGELLKILKEKEILLQEIHHRVKNNLAVISGLVELQNFYIKDEKAAAILKESRNRIKSIAVLHEKFYETKSLDKIEIRSYVDELIYFIQLSFSSQNKEIKIHTQIDFIEFSLADALPFSLLLNELITNSYKHAFTNKEKGNIYISLIKKGNNVIFHFKDDGDGFDYANFVKDNSLGMNLVEAFSNQLKGKMNYEAKKGIGINYTLHFKLL